MKKALIFSDSHGKNENMFDVISRYPEVDAIFHMGDIEGAADKLTQSVNCAVCIVRGNCDFTSKLPESRVIEFGGKRIAMCHGHRHLYSGNTDVLKYWGQEQKADIVMFGHTHIPYLEQGEKITLLNPGSISKPRQEKKIPTYALLEIDGEGHPHFTMCEYLSQTPPI